VNRSPSTPHGERLDDPAERGKAGVEHRVPPSNRAVTSLPQRRPVPDAVRRATPGFFIAENRAALGAAGPSKHH